ncbi:MAG: hypothetical protein QM744_13880 [Mesorhizobium sp.]
MKRWSDRLSQGAPVLKDAPRTIGDVVEGQRMLVPTARQVDDFIRSIPNGVEMDVRALRTALAIENGAEVSCPVYMGYHLRTVAEAAFEALEQGADVKDITPFWRVLDEQSPTTRKLSFGGDFVVGQRRSEGLRGKDNAAS